MTDFDQQYQTYLQQAERCLNALFTDRPAWSELYDSMRYSLLAGGKRLRPVLTMAFAAASGGDWMDAVPVACAVELVHTYSLIHDDLPCMDNDDLRRGKPSNHKQFGETLAVLSGDALQPAAYSLILDSPLPMAARLNCIRFLAEASGPDGMVAGQVLDTLHTASNETELETVHRLKTGRMIAAACKMGCAAANAPQSLQNAAAVYAENLGLAFQIRDDVLDAVSTTEELGKPVGSDALNQKITCVTLMGEDGCRTRIASCTEQAKAALHPSEWPGDLSFLQTLANRMANRQK